MLEKIAEGPMNANEISEVLCLDYKTVRHHLAVLQKNRLITTMGAGYGIMYFPSDLLEENMQDFYEIWKKTMGKKINEFKGKKVEKWLKMEKQKHLR